jgi:hypothetical protein
MKTGTETIHSIKMELLEMVESHDYSYMMSDDHSVWRSGIEVEKRIKAHINTLCEVYGIHADALYSEILESMIAWGFAVSSWAVGRVRDWFTPYIKDI